MLNFQNVAIQQLFCLTLIPLALLVNNKIHQNPTTAFVV